MIDISNIQTFGWEAAIRGMRNPMNSWNKSDSYLAIDCKKCGIREVDGFCIPKDHDCSQFECYAVGPNDLALMKKLVKAGSDHSKFMRMIHVQMDIAAPLYWWKEFDTYKVGTVANSCSTMHKIHAKEFTLDDFSHEHLADDIKLGLLHSKLLNSEETCIGFTASTPISFLNTTISILNGLRDKFVETKDKKYWWQMIQLLPSSYNQLRTVDLNYEVLRNMYFARKEHKLDEWKNFCEIMLNKLPYFEELIGEEE